MSEHSTSLYGSAYQKENTFHLPKLGSYLLLNIVTETWYEAKSKNTISIDKNTQPNAGCNSFKYLSL